MVVAVPGEGRLAGEDVRGDLVVVALPGVQRFIAEARSTADVAAASHIYATLAGRIVMFLQVEAGGDLVLPAAGTEHRIPGLTGAAGSEGEPGLGVPNRVVALFPPGTGLAAARRASNAARDAWQEWGRRVWDPDLAPETPGFPCVQWVCVPAGPGGYAAQWQQAQRLLAARVVSAVAAAGSEDLHARVPGSR